MYNRHFQFISTIILSNVYDLEENWSVGVSSQMIRSECLFLKKKNISKLGFETSFITFIVRSIKKNV